LFHGCIFDAQPQITRIVESLFLQAQYRQIYEHQQLRYWAQLEAGGKMALEQWHAIRENQQRLHVTINNNKKKQRLHAVNCKRIGCVMFEELKTSKQLD
jgi:hypothetical protein